MIIRLSALFSFLRAAARNNAAFPCGLYGYILHTAVRQHTRTKLCGLLACFCPRRIKKI